MAIEDTPEVDYRVKLRNARTFSEVVIFEATPDLIETRNVNYKTVDPVHAPGQIFAYQNTSSRTFNISSIRLISRTPQEARFNLQRLWVMRSWTMPRFGKSTLETDQRALRERIREVEAQGLVVDQNQAVEILGNDVGAERRGEPPAVLLLSAYSSEKKTQRFGDHINRVPVVVQNLSIPYPSDVDYIPAEGSNIPMPTIMTLDMTLTETHSPQEYEKFDLQSFKEGRLRSF